MFWNLLSSVIYIISIWKHSGISNFKRENFIAPKVKLYFMICKNVDLRYIIYSDAE